MHVRYIALVPSAKSITGSQLQASLVHTIFHE